MASETMTAVKTMKAVAISSFGGTEKLTVSKMPVPRPGPDEILVRVIAAGVNPVDCKIRKGLYQDRMPWSFPIIPGWDAAGIVEETGSRVTLYQPGDEVYAYCRKPVVQHGAYAEFITLTEEHVARKPSSLSFEEAAAVPLAGLTAYQALYETADVQPGETVLIHAAAGGVGSFAVQLARLRDAHVIGTASAANHEYLSWLGAQDIIDYTEQAFEQYIRENYPSGVDVVFDCAGGDTAGRSLPLVMANGRMVSITRRIDQELADYAAAAGITCSYVFVRPDHSQLDHLRLLLEKGDISVYVNSVFPLEEAARAHELIESRHTRGKIVLRIHSPR